MRSLVFALALSGCATGGGTSTCEPTERAAYPAGPYGLGEGGILADLAFVTSTGATFSLAEVHAGEGNALLWLNASAGWCTACAEEQATLQDFHQRYRERGLFVLVALFQDSNFNPADGGLAAGWQAQHDVSFTVVADPTYVLDPYFDEALTPMNMLVDACTMEILSVHTGTDTTAFAAILEARL